MQPIIGQNPEPPAFPDLRNLGTVVRILIGANLMFAVAALVRAPRFETWPEDWMDILSVGEPHLLFELTLLIALAPWLGRLAYRRAVGVVLLMTILIGVLDGLVLARITPLPGDSIPRQLALALIVTGTLLFYLHLRAKALSPSVIEARLQALQARIRPHFLFNSINAVLSLIRIDPLRAETALEDMADLFRVLMADNRNLVPLADEIALCRQYLALEQLRLGERLRTEWHLNSMPEDALIPPLVLQPLIENAVYHGIEPQSTRGVLSINVFTRDGQVHAILRNPFSADTERRHQGNRMALRNVRERLALHFDVEAALETQVKGDIYEVRIHLPYRRAVAAAAAAPAASGGGTGRDAGPGSGPARASRPLGGAGGPP